MTRKTKKFKKRIMPPTAKPHLRNLFLTRRNFKDRIFIKLFHDKKELLSLYNIFYNGEQEIPDQSEIRLSDAFLEDDGCLECIATVININLGHNEELMKGCNTLLQYAQFVDKVRFYYSHGYDHRSAIENAVEYCIEHDILRGFLLKNRNEVRYMFETDYSMKKFWAMKEYNHKKELEEKDEEIQQKDKEIQEKAKEIALLKAQLEAALHQKNN